MDILGNDWILPRFGILCRWYSILLGMAYIYLQENFQSHVHWSIDPMGIHYNHRHRPYHLLFYHVYTCQDHCVCRELNVGREGKKEISSMLDLLKKKGNRYR